MENYGRGVKESQKKQNGERENGWKKEKEFIIWINSLIL